eukprot:990-Heterococcus_DN1.PRE.7
MRNRTTMWKAEYIGCIASASMPMDESVFAFLKTISKQKISEECLQGDVASYIRVLLASRVQRVHCSVYS